MKGKILNLVRENIKSLYDWVGIDKSQKSTNHKGKRLKNETLDYTAIANFYLLKYTEAEREEGREKREKKER